MSTNNNSKSGVGFCGLLAIVFIVLKLTHYIDWSWLWVLSPLWIPVTIVLTVALFILALKSKAPDRTGKKKSGFAARLEKMQADQERMRKNND